MSSHKSGSMGLKAQGVNHPEGTTAGRKFSDFSPGHAEGLAGRIAGEEEPWQKRMRGATPPPPKKSAPVQSIEDKDDYGTDSYWERQEDTFNRKRAFSNPVKTTPPRKA